MSSARAHPTVAGFLGVALWGLVSGCNSQSSSEFHTYDQILATEVTPPALPHPSETLAATTVADVGQSLGDAQGSVTAEQIPSGFIPDSVLSPAPESPAGTSGDFYPEIPASALAPLNVVDGSSALDILKVADRGNMPSASRATEAAAPPAAPALSVRSIELLVPTKEFRAEGPQGALRVSYDDLDLLKVLNMEPVAADAASHFPNWLSRLDGQPIRIRGFMYPTFESSGIESFVLARDNQICCFGRDPKVYDLIQVSMKSGNTTDYIPNRPFDVVGTFRIEMLAEGGKPMGLYWLDDARVLTR